MRELRTSAVAAAVSGTLVGADRPVRRVEIDSRESVAGSLFFALPGERTDGHRFVPDALRRGATAAVVRRDISSAGPRILVDDPGEALLALASHERLALRSRVLGITGSVGKTTTKDFTAAVLEESFDVVASPRSFNNEIGLPLTILGADDRTDVLIAELGAGAVGEIARLCEVVHPHIGVVTAVGLAHLETFGSLERIAQAKAELVQALPTSGSAVLNADDPVVASFASRTEAAVMLYGRDPHAQVRAEDIRLDAAGRAGFTAVHEGQSARVRLRPLGEHMLTPALAAIACGVVFGIPVALSAERLRTTEAALGRMRQIETPAGFRILDDSYNANPLSMLAALRAVAAARDGRQAIAVLGPMAQLGTAATPEHERAGRVAARLRLDGLIVVGERARSIVDGALRAGMPRTRVRWCLESEEAVDVVLNSVATGDIVLVKASRVARFDRLVEQLCAS